MDSISIITPCYNAAKTLADCLGSVADQDYPNVEHILVDGKSGDASLEIARQFPHLSAIISEPDRGLYDAINKGILKSTGKWVAILNADDIYASQTVLSRVVETLNKTQSDTLYGDLNYVAPEDTSRVIRRWNSGPFQASRFRFGWMPPHPTFFTSRENYTNFGLYNTDFLIAADYELMLRFLYKNQLAVGYLPEVLVHMRTGGISNANLRNRMLANREDLKAWKVNQLKPHPLTRYLKPLSKIQQYF